MPRINSRVLGEWIQIAASVGVIAGAVLLIVEAARTGQSTESDDVPQVFDAAPKPRRGSSEEVPAEIPEERESELRAFLEQHCPACHGKRMNGSIGPALSKATLEHLSVNAVALTILHGRVEKGMPGWAAQLSENEALWIAALLKRDRTIE